jgi:hypothetical protein
MIKYYFILLVGFFFFASCEKKETPITLPAKGDGQVMQVDMGQAYEYQYFVSLSEQKIVHISQIDNWDLAFQSGENEKSIFLNGGKGMAAFNSNKSKFNEVNYNDTTEAKSSWAYDSPTGHSDSSAIGNWNLINPIYLVKLNEQGTKVRKLQILSEDPFQYVIAVGDIASTTPYNVIIPKNKNCNFTYFSFDKLAIVDNVEPNKNTWDLQFTRYNHTFYNINPVLRYVVTGVLLNPNNTKAYKDSLTNYNDIKSEFATSVPLSSVRDAIGFDWKSFSGAGGASGNDWTIVTKYNFIIQDKDQHHFKLRFLGFYSTTGVKGSPKFEYYQLN